MTKGFMLAVGVVLALWFVSVCNRVPLFHVTLPSVTFVPYPYPDGTGHGQPGGCQLEHVVGRGETQWTVAARYAGSQEKHLWLRRMRRASYLATDDDHLYPGQVLCVAW
jgi:hypothetical protein